MSLFSRIVERLAASDARLDDFKYYLLRHVELDGDQHGPMGRRLIECLCGGDPQSWQAAADAAREALAARLEFWDAIHAAVRGGCSG